MTLHWWMHWFWITLLTSSVCICSPVLPTAESSDVDISATTNVAIEPEYNVEGVSITTASSVIYDPKLSFTRGPRGGKAIGQDPSTALPPHLAVAVEFPLATSSDTGDEGSALQKELALHLNYNKKPLPTKVEEKSTSPTVEFTTITALLEKANDSTESPTSEIVTEIISLNISNPSNITSDVLVPNTANVSGDVVIVTVNTSDNSTSDNATSVVEVNVNKTSKFQERVSSSNDDIVEISTARALLLETSVGRRAADSEVVRKNAFPNDDEGLDAGAVAGICFGSLVIIGLAGAISLVLYRRRYLNKPQTLNDKCSNPDSSGYIDDSTMRENSEEMYSLDNDSFLNSLEAMTIQNYWTDTVKHTKL